MSSDRAKLEDCPLIAIAPDLRCGHVERNPARSWCARPAVAVEPGAVWELPAYRCARHASRAAVALSAILPFRRVRLMAQADFAAVTFASRPGEAEAIEQLERAVAAAGGLLTNVTASSAIVRRRRPEAALDAIGDKG